MNKRHLLSAAIVAALTSTSALATNGMMLEGYGARATALGGSSLAIDSGNSGAANNPATLSLMKDNARFGLGLRMLGPDITTTNTNFAPAPSADSDGTSYWMPSASYMRKTGDITYGVAMLAQGGMGTEYGNSQWPSGFSGQEIRSEVGVGALMFPISKQVNDRLTIGGAIDFVWAMMDLQMDMPAGAATTPGNPFMRVSMSDDNSMTGESKATGWAGQVGFTFAASDKVTIGGTYRSKTTLSDLKGDGNIGGGVIGNPATLAMGPTEEITVVDFQWPEMYGIGISLQATDRIMVTGDYKRYGWSETMNNFTLSSPTINAANGGNPMSMPMNWEDQNVFSLGIEYQATEKLALRVGANLSSNPVPNSTVNFLFPATIENHFTGGFGYKIDDNDKVGFSFTYAPEVAVTGTTATAQGNFGIQTSHSQFNWSLNYSHAF